MDNDEDVVPDGVVIFSSDDLLRTGLSLLGWTEGRIERQKENTNVDQYKGMYGLHLFAVAQLIEELQTTKTGSAKVEELDVEKLHWTLNFLYRYPRETEMESLWKKCAIDWNFIVQDGFLKILPYIFPTLFRNINRICCLHTFSFSSFLSSSFALWLIVVVVFCKNLAFCFHV